MLAVDLLDESSDHHLGGVEVCDDTVTERTDGLDARIRPFVHQLRLLADGDAAAGMVVNGDDTWLIENDLVVLEDDGVGCSKVNCQFLCQKCN